ncbi:class I SAM-dependent methyltransferase [Candidatus Woesearchaeota archaeon]|nr:class I SAM-dependent methyltransferase [Candidatus Woesearchaeota archaeon]
MNPKVFKRHIKSLPTHAKVLDAGCGAGNIARYIHNIRPDLEIFAIDIDKNQKKKIPSFARFSAMSVLNLDFKENYFDCVICSHVLEHLTDPTTAVSEFRRVLKVGGLVIAESPHWISTLMPIGYNFYDDPTHVRPHSKKGFASLFSRFTIAYLRFETPIFFFLPDFYNLKRFSLGYLLRNLIRVLGIYRTAVFVIGIKK